MADDSEGIQGDTSFDVSDVEAAIGQTTEKKQNAVSEAHAAVKRADPVIAKKAGDIAEEINTRIRDV